MHVMGVKRRKRSGKDMPQYATRPSKPLETDRSFRCRARSIGVVTLNNYFKLAWGANIFENFC